jgi:hypothetical protein
MQNTTVRDLAKAFYDAIITATTYIVDEATRNKVLHEIVETNKLLRKARPEVVVNAENVDEYVERRH